MPGSGQQNGLYFNLLRQLSAPFLMFVGRNYRLDVDSRYGPPRAMDLAFPLLATGTANIALPPLGTLRLDPSLMLALPALNVPQPAGTASTSFALPNNPSLIGAIVYAQALVAPGSATPRLTNPTADVILR